MGAGRVFWIEFGVVVAMVAVAAAALFATGMLDTVSLFQVGPVSFDAIALLFAVLAVGLFVVAIHGWSRQGAPETAGAARPGPAPAARLIELLTEHRAGSVREGEELDKHLGAVVEASRANLRADGAVLEIIEEGVIVKAFPAGSAEPYKGLRSNVHGTVLDKAFHAEAALRWVEPQTTERAVPLPGMTPEVRAMLLAPVRTGPRSLGILRVTSTNRHAFGEPDARLLEVLGRHVGSLLWKAPEGSFQEDEARREAAVRAEAVDAVVRFERLTESLEDAFWITDPTGERVQVANPAFERIWGRSTETLARSPQAWLETLEPEERKRVEKELSEDPADSVELTYALQRPDGSQRWIRHRRFPIRTDKGTVVGVGVLASDVTAEHERESSLDVVQRRLSEAVENGPIVAYAARPGGDYGLTFVTPNVEQQLGFAPDQFLSDPTFWPAHLHADDQPRVFEGFTKLFQKGRLEQEYRFRHADGTPHVLRDSARLVRSADGEPLEIVGFWMDVTEKKRAEEGVAYSLNRIKELQESRTRLLNNIAHDLASPLTPIDIQLHMLQENAALPEAARKGLDIVVRNVQHLKLLIQDLADVARLEGGQLRIDMQPVNVAEIVEKAVEGFKEPAKERGLTLKAKLGKDLKTSADGGRINQVVFNFLTNALKFTPSGGTVTVSAAKDASAITVRVQDSGKGLTPEEMSRLFKPFSQVHDRTQYKEKGTGLGLYICKGLIEKHGGKAWVESEGPGKGSSFSFSLPVKKG